MNKIPNTQKIKCITMYADAYTICEIGGDHYKNELVISFAPNDYYPDYTEVQTWIMKNIDGKVLNIEDVVAKIHEFLTETYAPKELSVRNEIRNCRTHFDVVVEK